MTFAPGMVVYGPGEGQRVPFMGNLHFNKAVAADTNGAGALVEQHMIGANPPLHQHAGAPRRAAHVRADAW